MKKLYTFCTAILLMLSCSINSVCGLDNNEDIIYKNDIILSTTRLNEFEQINSQIKYVQKKRNYYIIKNDIENYQLLLKAKSEFIQHIYDMKNLSVEELKKRNYTNDQIYAIQNYDGSDELSARAAATVKGTLTLNNYAYNSSKNTTQVKTTFTCTWNGTPAFKYSDHIGIGVAGSEASFFYDSASFICNKVDAGCKTNEVGSRHGGVGYSYKFDIADQHGTDVFQNVSMTYTCSAGGKVTVGEIEARYAHWQLAIGGAHFTITLSGNGAIAFDIGAQYNVECIKYVSLRM